MSTTALFVILFAVVLFFGRRMLGRVGHAKDPEGVVLLLDRPVPVTAERLAEVIAQETGRKVVIVKKGDGMPVGDLILTAETPAHYAVRIDGVSYAFHAIEHPYVDNPQTVAQDFPDLRLRKVVVEHKAWIAMDILDTEKANEQTYGTLARVLAHFVGVEFLAFYLPGENEFVPCSAESAVKHLRAKAPVAAIVGAIQSPMIHIDEDSPELKASVEEARRRFPEFVEALEKRTGEGFYVKTLLRSNENGEHIWVRVSSVKHGWVRGTVGNEPVDLKGYQLGSAVEFGEEAVEDWMFSRNGEPVGLFSRTAFEHAAHGN